MPHLHGAELPPIHHPPPRGQAALSFQDMMELDPSSPTTYTHAPWVPFEATQSSQNVLKMLILQLLVPWGTSVASHWP